jgi:hypothetical protein
MGSGLLMLAAFRRRVRRGKRPPKDVELCG